MSATLITAFKAADIALDGIQRIQKIYETATKMTDRNQSYIEQSALVRVEPACLVDMQLRGSDIIQDIQANCLNMFSGFYTQAITVAMANKEIDVTSVMAPFNINAASKVGNVKWETTKQLPQTMALAQAKIYVEDKLKQAGVTQSTASLESFRDARVQTELEYQRILPSFEDFTKTKHSFISIRQDLNKQRINPFTGVVRGYTYAKSSEALSSEADNNNPAQANNANTGTDDKKKPLNYGSAVGEMKTTDFNATNQSLSKVIDETNIMGKIISITITDRKQDPNEGDNPGKVYFPKVTIPVGIRLITGYIKNTFLVDLLSFGQKDVEELDRKIAHKLGKLNYFSDVILCRDLYRQFRRDLIKDKSGHLKTMLKDKTDASLFRMTSFGKNTSGYITSIAVLTSETARMLEENLAIRLSDATKRNKLMDITGMLLMVIVNEDHRMCKFYFHSIEKGLDATYQDLKKASKKEGLDVANISHMLSMGQAPRLM